MSAPDDGADVERSEVITLADAAERLSVSPRTIRRFISEGSLPGTGSAVTAVG